MATEFLPTPSIQRYYFTQHAGLRSVADGVTSNASTTVTSATANFNATYDVGATISGGSIPGGATIASVTNSTTVVISSSSGVTAATGVALTITRTNTLAISGLQAALIADWGASGTVAQLLPSTFQVLVNSNTPATGLVYINQGLTLTVAPGQWVGFNGGAWAVLPNSAMGGSSYTPATV